MDLLPKAITRPAVRIGAAAQNALEVARFGGLATDEEPSPYVVESEHRVYRLRHYHPGSEPAGPPVLLVPPMMLAAEVYDVSPSTSAVTILRQHGVDPWVVDFGAPEKEEGGLERTLTDHVLAVSDAVDRVRDAAGRDVHLGGYSQGGMFCYQTAAYRRSEGLSSLTTFGSPVDTRPPACARFARQRRGPMSTSWLCVRAISASWSARPRTGSPGRRSQPGQAGARETAICRRRSRRSPTRRRWSSRPKSATGSGTGSSWPPAWAPEWRAPCWARQAARSAAFAS
jgi:pimeloyl-ACP methyl ester carboxylesterase